MSNGIKIFNGYPDAQWTMAMFKYASARTFAIAANKARGTNNLRIYYGNQGSNNDDYSDENDEDTDDEEEDGDLEGFVVPDEGKTRKRKTSTKRKS